MKKFVFGATMAITLAVAVMLTMLTPSVQKVSAATQKSVASMTNDELNGAAQEVLAAYEENQSAIVPTTNASELEKRWTEILAERINRGLVQRPPGISGDAMARLAENTARHEVVYTGLKSTSNRSFELEFTLDGQPVRATVAGKPVTGTNTKGEPIAYLIQVKSTGVFISDSSKAPSEPDRSVLADNPRKLTAEQIAALKGDFSAET
jgi:hypothetical protein